MKTTTAIKTYYFTVKHPQSGETKIIRHPAVNLEMARKVLVIKCGKEILDLILETKVSA
jgi:hypothetical protein